MPRTIVILALAILVAPVASSDSSITVSALDCEFHLPSNYVVSPTPSGELLLRDPSPSSISSIVIKPRASDTPDPTKFKGQADESLAATIYRQTNAKAGLVLLRGREQEALFSGISSSEVEIYLSECRNSIDQVAVADYGRRSKGCKSLVRRSSVLQTLMGGSYSSSAVYSNAKLLGVRVRSTADTGKARISPDSIVTHICGVPADEFRLAPDSICCSSVQTEEIPVTVVSGGRTQIVLVPRDR